MQYIVFYPGETKSSMLWDSKEPPAAGKEVPAGSTIVEFKPTNGDLTLDNYVLEGKAITYNPPPPPPVAVPGMNLFLFNELFLQSYIEGLFTQSQLIDAQLAQKITDEQYRNAWLRGLIGNGSPEQQARLFEIAEACNIPLPQI